MASYEHRLAILCHTIPKEEREDCEILARNKVELLETAQLRKSDFASTGVESL